MIDVPPPADFRVSCSQFKTDFVFYDCYGFTLAALNVTSINYDCENSQETESCTVPTTTYFFKLYLNCVSE